MRGVARLNDSTMGSCRTHGSNISGTIITASTDDLTNTRGTARLTDSVLAACGCVSQISSCSDTFIVNDLGVARLGDSVSGPTYTAVITTASSNVLTK